MVRKSCLDCTRKHIAQAIVLFIEADMGYKMHYWLAMGHLAEGEAESLTKYPLVAERIRRVRKRILSGHHPSEINWIALLEYICLWEE